MNEAPCPRCGASVKFAKRPAIGTCSHCRTFLVYAGGTTLPARTFSRSPTTDGVFALVCNLCGGPLPALDPTSKVLSSVATIPQARRVRVLRYDADLPPTALAVLKLLVTRPSVAPPAVASLGRAWLGIGGLGLAVIGVAIARGPDHTTLDADVKGGGCRGSRRCSRSRALRPLSLARHHRSRSGRSPAMREGVGRRRGRGVARTDWVFLNHGSGTFLFGESALPAGSYQLQLLDFEGEAGAPKSLHVELDTLHGGPWGWLIIMANVLIWALVFDLRWTKGSLRDRPRRAAWCASSRSSRSRPWPSNHCIRWRTGRASSRAQEGRHGAGVVLWRRLPSSRARGRARAPLTDRPRRRSWPSGSAASAR